MPPVYEHGKIGVCVWIDQVETWIVMNSLKLDVFRRRYLIQCFPDLVIRDWVLKIGTQYTSWSQWTTAFRGSWRDREYEEALSHQATNVRQADAEDVLAYLMKKQAQFEYYCPKLHESQRVETALRLMQARYSTHFTGNYSCMRDVIADAPAVKSRVGYKSQSETPREYSLDPHVVVPVEEDRRLYKRIAQSRLPVQKRTEPVPAKKASTENIAGGKTARTFPNPASKVMPAFKKTERPSKPKVPFRQPRNINAADLRCFKCKGTGHFARDCKQPANRDEQSKMISMLRTMMLENNMDPDTVEIDGDPDSESESHHPDAEFEEEEEELDIDGEGLNVGADLYSEN